MTFQIYHNPRCKKSRAGLEFLKSRTSDFEIIEYLKAGISEEEIKLISKISGLKIIELVRIQEEFYKKNLKGKALSDEALIKNISENPKLLKRPIVIKEKSAIIADPPENINLIF